jgi:hypothetical protein
MKTVAVSSADEKYAMDISIYLCIMSIYNTHTYMQSMYMYVHVCACMYMDMHVCTCMYVCVVGVRV